MRTSEMFPSKYISESDLAGQERTMTMRNIEFEEVGQQKDRKPVLYFEKAQKGLVLNKTNTRKIESLYGTDTDDWMGHQIALYPSETDFQGETVACIRVRAPRSNGAAAKPKSTIEQGTALGGGPSSYGKTLHTERDPPPIEDDDSAIPF